MGGNFYTRTVKRSGFTIVELLIVIVVIAILATIVTTAYNGVQRNALNVHKLSALTDWRDLLQVYAAKNQGKYPTPSVRSPEYCLGEDFVFDACWNVYDVYGTSGVYGSGPKPNEPVAKTDGQLMEQLKTVGALPGRSTCLVSWYCPVGANDGVGPMVSYRNGKPSVVWDFFLGGSCPAELEVKWTDGNASTCELRVASLKEIEVTNLMVNPSVETSATSWSVGAWGTNGNGQFTNETNGGAASGSRYQRMRWTQAGTWSESTAPYALAMSNAAINPGSLYTCSANVRSSLTTARVSIRLVWVNSMGAWLSQTPSGDSIVDSVWSGRRVVVEGNAPAGSTTAYCLVRLSNITTIPANATFDVDAMMLLQGEDTYRYADGDVSGWVWNGTPHASSSSGPAL